MRIHEKTGRQIPWYQDIDGFRLAGFFSADAYRSAIAYKPRPDDLFIVTYPKCGTTWVQNIIACILNEGQPIKDIVDFFKSTPFLEMYGAEAAEKMKRPGAIKVHLPFHLTPYSPEAKYIFVTRNPKDCVVSFYYHTKQVAYDFKHGSFDDYFELFINGETDCGDYFDTLLSWYEHRNDPNVLFLTYEDIKKDTEGNILKIAEFIDPKYKAMLDEDPTKLANIIKYSSIPYMRETFNNGLKKLFKMSPEEIEAADFPDGLKKVITTMSASSDESSHEFIRKGIVGDWRTHLSEEQNARLEKKFYERTKGTDIPDMWKDCMQR